MENEQSNRKNIKISHSIKQYIIFLVFGALSMISIIGCGSSDDVNETTLTISSKGVITHKIIESFDKDYYDEEELKGQIEEQISDYCEDKGDDKAVKLKYLKVDDGLATAELTFADYSDYAAFNDVDFFYGTVSEAMSKEYETDVTLKSSEDDETIGKYEFESLGDSMIIVTGEPILIKVPGKIAYTTANIDVIDKETAKMASDSAGVGYIVLK